MTMRELARLANVSVSTVSKAFHDADDVSRETKELVFTAAKQYGCYGKFYKGKFHKQIIAIICPELSDGYYSECVERLRRTVEKNGGIALISADHFDAATQQELMEYYASYLQVDGIMVFYLRDKLKKGYEVPVVSLMDPPNGRIDTINLDLRTPIYEIVCHLKELGHEKIAYIGEPLAANKEKYFLDAAEKAGVKHTCVIESKYRFEKAGEDGAMQLLQKDPECTAILCGYDNIAFGAIRHLKRCGYRVPEDFSVVGMDNVGESGYVETALTTIDSNMDQLCALAWEIIQKKQESKFYACTQSITITGSPVYRETVGTPRLKKVVGHSQR